VPPTPDSRSLYAGVDLGGTNIAFGLARRDGPLTRRWSLPTDAHRGPDAVLTAVADSLRQAAGEPLAAIGIGLPGLLDLRKGHSLFLPNLPTQWRNVPVAAMLAERAAAPVYLLNDARLATLGEFHFGWGREASTLVCFTLGTGVGGGIVIDGKLRLGPLGAAGEIGHQTVVPDGPLCGCGNHGCLEVLASGPAITAEGVRLMLAGQAPHLHELTSGDPARVNPATIAAAGDPALEHALDRIAAYLAVAIANLVTSLHPDIVVIAGGVAAIGEPLLRRLRAQVRERVRMFPIDSLRIERSQLGGDAGVLGGIALARLGGILTLTTQP
jgi:glucokinase